MRQSRIYAIIGMTLLLTACEKSLPPSEIRRQEQQCLDAGGWAETGAYGPGSDTTAVNCRMGDHQ